MPILHTGSPTQRLSSMVVAQDVHERLDHIIREQRHFARIREHVLSPRGKPLLVGPRVLPTTLPAQPTTPIVAELTHNRLIRPGDSEG